VVGVTDRIPLYPKLDISHTPVGGKGGGDGTAESGKGSGMEAELVRIDSMGKTRNAPKDFPSASAGVGTNDG
jgi:hypothetical protein